MFNSNTLLRFQNILFGGKYIAFFYNAQQFLEKFLNTIKIIKKNEHNVTESGNHVDTRLPLFSNIDIIISSFP